MSWIIWVGPKCNHMCPYQREAEGVSRDTHRMARREGGHVKTEAEIRVMRPQAYECQEPPELKAVRNGFSSRAFWRE